MTRKRILAAVAAIVAVALACPQRAHAQWVVSDPSNLVQNILQYMQDALMEGDFDEVSKLAEARQSYTDLRNRLEEFGQMKDFLRSMGKVGRQIEEITAFGKHVASAGENFSLYLDYFRVCDDYNFYRSARNMHNIYNEMSSDIITEMNELFKAITSMKQGTGLIDYVEAIEKVTSQCNERLALLEDEVGKYMSALLHEQKRKSETAADSKLLNKVIL